MPASVASTRACAEQTRWHVGAAAERWSPDPALGAVYAPQAFRTESTAPSRLHVQSSMLELPRWGVEQEIPPGQLLGLGSRACFSRSLSPAPVYLVLSRWLSMGGSFVSMCPILFHSANVNAWHPPRANVQHQVRGAPPGQQDHASQRWCLRAPRQYFPSLLTSHSCVEGCHRWVEWMPRTSAPQGEDPGVVESLPRIQGGAPGPLVLQWNYP